MRSFVREEIFPLDTLRLPYDDVLKLIKPLQEQVKPRRPMGGDTPPSRTRRHGVRTGHSLLEFGHVGQVLGTSNGPLVGNEVFATNEWDLPTIYFDFHTSIPRLIKTYPIDAREQVDSIRWMTQLDHGVGTEEILTRDIERIEAI